LFLAGLFRRELAGFLEVARESNCGRDDCVRDFGHGGHKNLSGAISWFTFLRAA
jgi:hypothetical protein